MCCCAATSGWYPAVWMKHWYCSRLWCRLWHRLQRPEFDLSNTMSSANLSVLVGKNFACIKICGRANFACSPDFKTLLSELNQKGFKHYILDLGECILMDS